MKWLFTLLLVRAVLSINDPEESENRNISGIFEGDMILTQDQIYHAEHGEDVDSDRKRGSVRNRNMHWPNAVLVYEFAAGTDERAKNAIRAAMAEWTSKTCIRFKQRTNEAGYVSIQSTRPRACYANVGRLGGRQVLNLGEGCWHKGTAAHEIAHALGFYHEQSRTDRDEYVTIYEENIKDGMLHNFKKYPKHQIDSLGTRYDYGSLMHYPHWAFSKNGRPTILPKKSGVRIGQREGLSTIDAEEANLLYCRATTTPRPAESCKDTSQYCSSWVRHGYCSHSSYGPYVQAACQKSCNKCGCRDTHRSCPNWTGHCSSNSYVKLVCKKTCNLC